MSENHYVTIGDKPVCLKVFGSHTAKTRHLQDSRGVIRQRPWSIQTVSLSFEVNRQRPDNG
ncbi:hypothetical protein DPMN_098823 [Dreissena polymorpha]|uniref:Uncharacterized protein n=1 Tax=Dreissena polymorpha TaxID=45954 RepID=A0A9D4LED7_DREPO|nr:hypothetical protein DPMN_098823 [Dreissena polymorpha]